MAEQGQKNKEIPELKISLKTKMSDNRKKAGCAGSTFRFLHKVVQLNKMYSGPAPSGVGSHPDWSSCQNSFKIDQHPHPLLPNPPQQQSRRMIHRQLSLPHPLPPNVLPPHPPQQQSRRMIHRQEDIPFPLSHPHPQFVAVKSLMLNPPIRLLFTVLRPRR